MKGSGSEMWAQAAMNAVAPDDEEGLAGEGFLKGSGAVMEAELGGNRRMHRGRSLSCLKGFNSWKGRNGKADRHPTYQG